MEQSDAVNFVAGGISGVAVDAVLFPLDTMKTVLQSRNAATAKPLQLSGLYRGLLSAMAGSFPSAATFWVMYDGTKSRLSRWTGGQYLPLVHFASVVCAEVAVVAVRNPFEVVKQQMQLGMHKSTSSAVKDILKIDGVRGLYAGYLSMLAREIPFDALQFMTYEFCKARYLASTQRDDLKLWENCLLGSSAGAVSAAATTPLDVAKTRLMTQTGVEQAKKYRGVADALRTIYAKEGLPALFSGVRQRVMWISLGGAIFFGTFEEMKRQLSSV